jgi:LysR family transcriptional regulator, nod-box dependent transcriptional activator
MNLNHLPILREILRQKNLTKAAAVLNLTQPAVSNVLRLLRSHFGDSMLVRDGVGLRLTPKGKQVLGFLETALAYVETAIEGADFDPAIATGPIRIATVDNVISALAGPVCTILADEAPHLQAQFLTATQRSALDLRAGALDILITSSLMMESGLVDETTRRELRSRSLAEERLVCIGARDDAELTAGLSLDAYLARAHVSYIVDAEQHQTVERRRLSELGLNQMTRIATSSNLSLPSIVAQGGCLSLVPESLAQSACALYPIQIVDPPLDLPNIHWVMVWHERSDDSPLVQWAIDVITRCAGIFGEGATEAGGAG